MALLFLAGDLRSELNGLIETERAFARLSIAEGTREAFLANLSDESIIFRPGPVLGKPWMEKNTPAPVQLSWEPEFADISVSADLGYTTGPWEIRRTPDDPPEAFGHYVTVWKRQPGGAWKIALDYGNGHASGSKPKSVATPKLPADLQKRRAETDIQKDRKTLLDIENAFPANLDSYLSLFASDARLYRKDSFPLTGMVAIRKMLAGEKSSRAWKVVNGDVAGALDLAYTYGTVDDANYLRIWKKQRNNTWKIVLDLVS